MKSTGLQELRGHELIYDPRPEKYRNTEGYADHFRNIILNSNVS